ncbi:MAG: hypothetical protein HYY28_13635 [Betaproteobacteria bacterium]|nr:hypothetical protein [Betaproteobacteria bacterium]MBI2961349.1 hypothetical protein [Betaproteobacteria bacterium]
MTNNFKPRQRKKKSKPAEPRLSRLHAPPGLPPEKWQIALRRQFGREQSFAIENLGSERFFSEFRVLNPASGGRYRVAIGGMGLGEELLFVS